ncbi:Alpha-L-fucosidase [Trichinella nelsoni]|uniref:Putative alpha-L-fucosidase n=1 Tax=Trichinella nelsoni TaxID=6336 RepID=A0A0V0S4K8_9BILA|nr:Alpha-L-fucosidase [Trichinella nelsoni]
MIFVWKVFLVLSFTVWQFFASADYEPNWDSLDSRPIPCWFDEAKFGIFMHFGLYSVPSYGYSSEWFWWWWKGENRIDQRKFMAENFKPGFSYPDFIPGLTCELFDAEHFADVVKKSGAKYFVFTSKHHDGFAMWPTNYSWNYNSYDVGPKKDIVGELAKYVRKAGVRFGLYYSLYQWFHPLYMWDASENFKNQRYVEAVVRPQLRELIETYKPDLLWSDGDWDAPVEYWNSTNFLAWLYNESPIKDVVVTNDRWGKGAMCHHGGFLTCTDRYNPGTLQKRKWENCFSIDKISWGYRREATLDDYHTAERLIETMIETVSCGGNYLLNIAPTADGRIMPIFEERLTQIGEWLKINGEAIFQTIPWKYQNDTTTANVWYTFKMANYSHYKTNQSRNNFSAVYAFFFNIPEDGILILGCPKGGPRTQIQLLGFPGNLNYNLLKPKGLKIDLKSVKYVSNVNCCWVLKIVGLLPE